MSSTLRGVGGAPRPLRVHREKRRVGRGRKVIRLALSRPFGDKGSGPNAGTGADTTNLSATSSKVNLALHAPSCPINLKLEKEFLSSTGEGGSGSSLPLEVRRLAGDFVDSEQCSQVPQGWWKWWRYQGL